MRRAFMWLNLYGREAVQHKLKNPIDAAERDNERKYRENSDPPYNQL